MKKETGITIVALVVTIVVMLILVGVSVTVSINGGLFNTTKESTYKTEVSQVKEALEEEIVQRKARRESVDNITIKDLDIPNKIKDKYKDKLIIIGKDIYYDPSNIEKDNEEAWLEDMDIIANTKFFTYNTNGDTITGLSESGYTAIENGVTKFVMPTKYVSKDANGNRKVTTITTIEKNAFNATVEGKGACAKIKSVIFPTTLTTLKTNAFDGCNGLEKIDLSETQVTSIWQNAFSYCMNLKEAILPENLTSLGSFAFWHCEKMEKINLGRITSVSPYCFQYCTNLKNIEIPDSVTSIRECSFQCCSSLEKLIIPNSVTNINFAAFANCEKIQEIRIPSSVTTISYNVFYGSAIDGKIYVPYTKEEGKPSGWHDQWNSRSGATIIYADETT